MGIEVGRPYTRPKREGKIEFIEAEGRIPARETKTNLCPKTNVQMHLHLRRSRHGNHILPAKRRCPDSAGRRR